MLEFDHVKIGDFKYIPTTKNLMADTGTSLNMLPDEDFYPIVNHFFGDKKCHTLLNSLTACACTKEEHEAVPPLTF